AILGRPGISTPALAERVRRQLAGAGVEVVTPDQWASQQPASQDYQSVLGSLAGLLAGIAGLAAIFVLSSMFTLVVLRRRRELALLRAVGATPNQVRRLVVGEALLMSAIAAAIGGTAGWPVGARLGRAMSDSGIVPPIHMVFDPIPLGLAAVAGIAITVLSVLLAAWRAGRISPLEALGEASLDRSGIGRPRLIVGLGFLAVGLAVLGVSSAV